MGDFGPAYMSSSRPTAQLYRCDDCSVTMPAAAASDDALCPSCGGTLRSLGVGGAAPPDASARTGVRGTGVSAAEMASVVLSEILSPGLLESLGAAGETSRWAPLGVPPHWTKTQNSHEASARTARLGREED